MTDWKVFGSREQHKVRLASKGRLEIDGDVWERAGFAASTPTLALEGLTSDQPRAFALRPCTTGMAITFRRSVRKGGAVIWRGNVVDVTDAVGLAAWRGEILDTNWSCEDGLLVVAVPMGRLEGRYMEEDSAEQPDA